MKKIALVIVIVGIALVKFLPSSKADASSVGNVGSVDINNNVNVAELNTITDPRAQAGLSYYLEKTQDDTDVSNLEARVKNLGCHSEIYIYKSGELVMRMAYFGGQIYEL